MTTTHATSAPSQLIDAQFDGASQSVSGVVLLFGQYYRVEGRVEFEIPTANDGIPEKLMPQELMDELIQSEMNHNFRPFGYLSCDASCRYFILRGLERLSNTEEGVLLPDDVWGSLHKALVAEWGELDDYTLYAWRKEFSQQWWAIKRLLEEIA